MNILTLMDRMAIDSIGWTLLHSLWQGVVICLLMLAAMKLIPSKNPQLRYLTASLALISLTIWIVFTYFTLGGTTNQVPFSAALLFDSTSLDISSPISDTGIAQNLSLFFPYLVLAWILGAGWMSIRTVGGLIQVQRLSNKKRIYLPESWNEKFRELKSKMGVSREVKFCLTYSIESPVTLGAFRPIIYFPFSLFSGLNEDQIEAILAHELAHIRRQDYLLNIIQSFIESMLFFNPFVWFISSIIREEREFCCDKEAIALKGDPMGYAKMLTELEWKRIKGNTLSMGIAGQKKSLLTRIKRIMGKETNQSSHARMVIAVLLLTTIGLISWKTINGRSVESPDSSIAEVLEATLLPAEIERPSLLQAQDTVKTKKKDNKGQTKAKDRGDKKRKDNDKGSESEIVELKRIIEQQQQELERYHETMSKQMSEEMLPKMLKENQELSRLLEEELKNVNKITEHELKRALDMKLHGLNETTPHFPMDFDFTMPDFNFDFEFNMDSLHKALRNSEYALHESMKHVHELNKLEMEEQMQKMEEQMRDFAFDKEVMREQMEDARKQIREMETKFKKLELAMEKALKEEGTLGKNESLESLEIRDGELESVNGKEYNGSNSARYRALIKEHIGDSSGNFSIRK